MRRFLPLLLLLLLLLPCVTSTRSVFHGTCPRRDPPPGVLVLSPGSSVVLSCSGDVSVDGVRIGAYNLSRGGAANAPHRGGVSTTGDAEDGWSGGHTASPTPPGMEEEEEGGSRVTRGLTPRPQWRWNGRTVGSGHRDWGGLSFQRGGAALSVAAVRPKDTGNYECRHRGRTTFSLKLIIADPPETPSLSCYKRSPSSKIRCEWRPRTAPTLRPDCYLFFMKSPTAAFRRHRCSYSSLTARCWCALEHSDDELKTPHVAFMCVTNAAGSATSAIESFVPLDILRPDPPSAVSVQQEEGHDTKLDVTWGFPTSWKSRDRFYELVYELKYQPSSLSSHGQIMSINRKQSYTIMDAMAGVEYAIELRAKDEFDGHWSTWSKPVYASSWTDSGADLVTTAFPSYEGSGVETDTSDAPEPVHTLDVSYSILWIFGAFAVLSGILAAYVFRDKDRCISKLRSLSFITERGGSSRSAPSAPPHAPQAPQAQAVLTFAPPGSGDVEGEDENEEQMATERTEVLHFNNTSYFLMTTK